MLLGTHYKQLLPSEARRKEETTMHFVWPRILSEARWDRVIYGVATRVRANGRDDDAAVGFSYHAVVSAQLM